jgi:iron complex transport system permease protein
MSNPVSNEVSVLPMKADGVSGIPANLQSASLVPAQVREREARLAHRARSRRLRRLVRLVVILGVATAAIVVATLCLGAPRESLADLARILTHPHDGSLDTLAVWQARLPRASVAVCVGASLSIAGTLLQIGMRNPIASPELLGVTNGAALVMAIIIMLGVPVPVAIQPFIALLGGITAGVLVIMMNRGSRAPLRLILTGVAVSATLKAAIVITIGFAASDQTVSKFFQFLVGNLQGLTWVHAKYFVPWLFVGAAAAFLLAKPLNVLRLGEEMAEALGVKVTRLRIILMLVSGVLVAGSVALCGPIAFVALLAPHLARRLLGTSDVRELLPAAALTGALLLAIADLIAAQAFAPMEIPAGVATSAIGAPVLLLMLRRQMKERG